MLLQIDSNTTINTERLRTVTLHYEANDLTLALDFDDKTKLATHFRYDEILIRPRGRNLFESLGFDSDKIRAKIEYILGVRSKDAIEQNETSCYER